MTVTITTANFCGALVILGSVTLLQSPGASAKFYLKTHQDTQLLGSSKCLIGPGYWCISMSNAVDCKAVDYCIQTTWRIQKHPKNVKGASCLLCEKWIDLVLEKIKDHNSQDQLIKDLDKVCDLLRSPSRISDCKSEINSVIPLIIDSTKVAVNSRSICFLLKACLTPLADKLEIGKEATIHLEEVNTDDQNEQNPKHISSVLNHFKPELESSFIDSVLRKMRTTNAVYDPITLLNDKITQKSEEPSTVLNYLS